MSTLRIFADGQSSPASKSEHVSAHCTLRQFYEGYLVSEHFLKHKAGSLKDHRSTLKHWENATANPLLIKINDRTITKFRAYLATHVYRGEPLAEATQRKHLVNLQCMLDRAGPQLRRDLPTAKLLPQQFAIPKPTLDEDSLEDCFTLDEIASYLAACQFARYPLGFTTIAPCAFWRCAGLLAYNSALRLCTLLALRWEWEEKDEHGIWFNIPGWAMKRKRRFKCYMNEHAVRVLGKLRGCHPERVLPWEWAEDWFHKCRRKLLESSSIPPHRQFGFHAFRKALATELGQINTFAATLQLGHKSKNVTLNNYTHRRLLVAAHERLPQPQWCGDFDGRQGMLF
jgi:integrase